MKASDEDIAAASRRAIDGTLDDTGRLLLFLSGAGGGSGLVRCGPTCKGNPRRPDCVCGLVPPEGSFRKKGLWRKDADALLENLGRDPADLKRLARTHPAGLKNLGNTCYVNAVLQCLFAIPTFRAAVYRLGPGDTNDGHTNDGHANDGHVNDGHANDGHANDGHATATASRDDTVSPVKELRRLFASLQCGGRRFADPARFADSLALETGTQQDGQEFLKLLLTYLERVAGERWGRGKDATFVQTHFRGESSYATTCQRCGRASAASKNATDFYEVELCVGATVGGMYVGGVEGTAVHPDSGITLNGGLMDSLRQYLAEERLEGDNKYHCEFCDAKVDAVRAVRLHRLPRYVNFQLKRFVFDFDTMSRRKVTDDFEFPPSVNLGELVSPLPEDEAVARAPGEGESSWYDLAFILVHRGHNATSGHYVALVRGDYMTGDESSERAGNWWRFDDDEVEELKGGPFGEPVAPPLAPSACTPGGSGADKAATDDDGFKATADNTPIVGGKGDASDPFEFTDDDPLAGPLRMLSSPHPNVTERKKTPGSKRGKARITPLSAKKDDGPMPGRPKKGRDGSTRFDGTYSSPDAYLLVYRRRDGSENSADSVPEVPTDLAAMIEDDDKELAAMIETHAARIEEEKERIQTRKRQAREVAEAAPCAQPRGGDEEDGDEDGDGDEEDVAGCRDQNVAGCRDQDPDDYYLIPSEYLASFCDEPANPAPVDTTSLLCAHGLADPVKATSAKRITRAAWWAIIAAAGLKDGCVQLRGSAGICCRCLNSSARSAADSKEAQADRARLRDELQTWMVASEISHDPELFGSGSTSQRYLVSKTWLDRWKTWKSGEAHPAVALGPTSAITCEHGMLLPWAKRVAVPETIWNRLIASVSPAALKGNGTHAGTDGTGEDADENAKDDDDKDSAAGFAGDDDVFIVGETGRGATKAKKRGRDIKPRWTGPPATFPDGSTSECPTCTSAKEGDLNASRERRNLAEIHRNLCDELLTKATFEQQVEQAPDGTGVVREERIVPCRAMPGPWLARWRRFATDGDSTEDGDFEPTRESLEKAAAALRCAHSLCRFGAPAMEPSSSLGAVGPYRQVSMEDPDADGVELVSAAAFESLEEVLEGRCESVPRAAVTFGGFMSSNSRDTPPAPTATVRDPATCEECDRARLDAEATFFGAVVRVVKVKSPPEPVPGLGSSSSGSRLAEDRSSPSQPTPPGEHLSDVTFSASGRRRVAPAKWWQVNGGSSAKPASASAPAASGKGVAFTVDATYSVWRLKLMALERLHVHPLDQKMYSFATGVELRDGDTLGAAGVRPEQKIAVVCGDEHDPEDLTGLDMPLGPVRWEDGASGRERGGREENAAQRAPERGFAGTGLHGVG